MAVRSLLWSPTGTGLIEASGRWLDRAWSATQSRLQRLRWHPAAPSARTSRADRGTRGVLSRVDDWLDRDGFGWM